MNEARRYAKVVVWSDEDQCYIGGVPGLFDAGCHGDDERAVYAELCEIVEEIIELHEADGSELPMPTNDLLERLWDERRERSSDPKQAAE